jgi:hypothetical protein
LLLLRVRDEIRMTINAYQTLYESAIAWGMRKALESEQGKADMEKKASIPRAYESPLSFHTFRIRFHICNSNVFDSIFATRKC